MELEEKLIKKGTDALEKEFNEEIKKGTFLNSFKFSFLVLLIFLAISIHPDLLSSPIEIFSYLSEATAYGMGAYHPIGFTLLAYPFFAIIKFVAKPIVRPLLKAFLKDTLKTVI